MDVLHEAVRQVVERAGKAETVSDITARERPVKLAEGVWATLRPTYHENQRFNCVYQDALAILPGQLLSLRRLGRPAVLSVGRAPITLSMGGLETARISGDRLSYTVQEPKTSTIREGISRLVKSALLDTTEIAALAMTETTAFSSEEQLNLRVTAGVGYGAVAFKGSLDWSNRKRQTRLLFTYQQPYFTIDVDEMDLPAAFFSDAVDAGDLARKLGPGSRPAYVSSVTYGISAYTMIETEVEEQAVRAAIDATYKAAGTTAEASLSLEHSKVLQRCHMDSYVFGGSTSNLLNITEQGYDGLKKVLAASTGHEMHSTPVPISYKLANLVDGTPVSVRLEDAQLVLPVCVSVTSIDLVQANQEVLMDRAFVWASAPPAPEVPVLQHYNKKYTKMYNGSSFRQGGSAVLDVPLPHADPSAFADAALSVRAMVRDWAPGILEDYWAEGSETLRGPAIIGPHKLRISPASEPAKVLTFDVGYDVQSQVPAPVLPKGGKAKAIEPAK